MLSTAFQQSHALFEDQAFKFDWRQRYIGSPVKVLSWTDSGSPRSEHVLTITKSNVIAAINVENGVLK